MTKGLPRHRETWWWNRDVEKVVAKRKVCHKAWRKSKSAEYKDTLDVAKKEVYTAVLAAQESNYKNSLLIFRANLAGRTVSGLIDRWLEREEMSSACAVLKMMSGMLCLMLFAMIRSVVKSFKVPDVEVVAARMSNESALT